MNLLLWCGRESPRGAIKRSAGARRAAARASQRRRSPGLRAAGSRQRALSMRDMPNAGSGPDSISEPLNHGLNRRPPLQERLPGLRKYTFAAARAFTALCGEHFRLSSLTLRHAAVYQTDTVGVHMVIWSQFLACEE